MSARIPRRAYTDFYGPTTGDRVRLADTELIIEVERDCTVYGDEIAFGGGKVIRDGMGQSSRATREASPGALDLVVTNALIVDHWGIVKADIGVRDGRIVKIGKAGNPDVMQGVDPDLVVGAATESDFIAVHRRVALHFDDQFGVGEADAIAGCGAVEIGIRTPWDSCAHSFPLTFP